MGVQSEVTLKARQKRGTQRLEETEADDKRARKKSGEAHDPRAS